MKNTVLSILTVGCVILASSTMAQSSIYDFKVDGLTGEEINFADFKGKKILIVNTASKCGFTKQYIQLQELYDKHGKNIVVVGFPANNFGKQEPGTNEEIDTFCKKNYGVSFPMASKVSVRGDDMHALFSWMTELENPDFTGNIKWNFEKFLFDENGNLIHRYRSQTSPTDEKITSLL
jgi:glutathione peroxidase